MIGSFTTNHPAGEPRVTNIHRMADIVEGAIIAPGGTFSLNGWVGERTLEKGFVEAPVIDAEYKFSKDVGGGVSQFSTTLFNAAFFAGLDIPTYGMHGIYIARYPYGREATLDFPSLDLKVSNPTPYGVLIWPTYSASSITVTLYSTRTVEGAQTNQTTSEIPTSEVKEVAPPTTAAPDPNVPVDPNAPTTEPPVPRPPHPRCTCAPGWSPSAPAPTPTAAPPSTSTSPCTPPRKVWSVLDERRIDARATARAIPWGRIALGASYSLAPGLALRLWPGGGAHRDPAARFLARSTGVRDLAIGLGTLMAVRKGGAVRGWLEAGMLADAGDAAAVLLGYPLPPPGPGPARPHRGPRHGRRRPAPGRRPRLAMKWAA